MISRAISLTGRKRLGGRGEGGGEKAQKVCERETSVSSERVLTVYTLTSEFIFSILFPQIFYGADKENLSNNQGPI